MSSERNIQYNFDCILKGSCRDLTNNLLRQKAQQELDILELVQLFRENS